MKIKELTKNQVIDNINYSIESDDIVMPKHEGMSQYKYNGHWSMRCNYRRSEKISTQYRIADRLLEKYYLKPYDDYIAALKKKCPPIGDIDVSKTYQRLQETKLGYNCGFYNYYLDEDNIIRKKILTRNKKDIIYCAGSYIYEYHPHPERMSDDMLEFLSKKLCKSDFLDIKTGTAVVFNYAVYRISEAISDYLNSKLDKSKDPIYWNRQLDIDKYFERIDLTEYKVYSKKSREYKKKHAEEIDKKKKEKRDNKKEDPFLTK